jgi:hypothetical protein
MMLLVPKGSTFGTYNKKEIIEVSLQLYKEAQLGGKNRIKDSSSPFRSLESRKEQNLPPLSFQ